MSKFPVSDTNYNVIDAAVAMVESQVQKNTSLFSAVVQGLSYTQSMDIKTSENHTEMAAVNWLHM